MCPHMHVCIIIIIMINLSFLYIPQKKQTNKKSPGWNFMLDSVGTILVPATLCPRWNLNLPSEREAWETEPEREQCLKLSFHCLRKRAAPVCIHRLGFEPQGKQMCVTTFTLSELVYKGSKIVSTWPGGSSEVFNQKKETVTNECTTWQSLKIP